ncbi:MAG: tetratricopeptide repeat protein, partial [Bacteroidetes bacterium]|nr:tetratricopeptide repeat protein [Bacteroidota bacterium]
MRAARILLPLFIIILHTACGAAKKTPAAKTNISSADDGSEVTFASSYINAESQYLSGAGDLGLASFLALEKEQADNAAVHYRIACIYEAQQRYTEALFFIKKARKLDPKNRWYRELEASLLEETGEPAQAAAIFEQLMSEDPARSVFFQEALRLQLKAGNRAKAMDLINRREQQVGLRPYTTERKIQLLKAEGRYLDAADEMKRLREKYPDRSVYAFREAELSLDAGNAERAIPLLNNVLAQNPSDFKAEALLLQIRLSRGETAGSFGPLQRLLVNDELDFQRKKDLLDLWQKHIRVSNDSMARILNLLEQAHGNEPVALEYCGDLAAARKMDSLAATYYLHMLYADSVLNKEPHFIQYAKTVNALRLVTNWSRLYDIGSEMTELFPAMAQAHLWKAYGAFQLNNLDIAEESAAYGMSMAFKAEDDLALRALMQRILCARGRTDEAMVLARSGVQKWPAEPWAKAQLAYMLARTGA